MTIYDDLWRARKRSKKGRFLPLFGTFFFDKNPKKVKSSRKKIFYAGCTKGANSREEHLEKKSFFRFEGRTFGQKPDFGHFRRTSFSTFFTFFTFFSIKSDHFFGLFFGPGNLSILWRFMTFFLEPLFFAINPDFIDFLETGGSRKGRFFPILKHFRGKKGHFEILRFFWIFWRFWVKMHEN